MIINFLRFSGLAVLVSLTIFKGSAEDLGSRDSCNPFDNEDASNLVKYFAKNKEKFSFMDTCDMISVKHNGSAYSLLPDDLLEPGSHVTVAALCKTPQNKVVESAINHFPVIVTCTTKVIHKKTRYYRKLKLPFGIQNNNGKLDFVSVPDTENK